MGQRVLITGADGFIGSHLAEALLKKGHKIRALAQYNSFGSLGWLDHSPLSKEMEIISGDIRDPFLCQSLAKDIDTVYHLAALIAIPYSYHAPQSYVETNVTGTLNICQAALKNGVSRVLHTSTSEVYGTARYVPIDEAHPLQAQSPYSASKIGADSMAFSYFAAFGLPLLIVRPFNTYGPRQSARAIIPTIITQALSGFSRIRLGSLAPTRDLNYIEDTVNGFMAAGESSKGAGEVVNFGSAFEIKMGDLAHRILALCGSEAEIVSEEARLRPASSEVERLFACNQKAQKLFGWSPAFGGLEGLDLGLKKTIEWFSNPLNLKAYKADQYNI